MQPLAKPFPNKHTGRQWINSRLIGNTVHAIKRPIAAHHSSHHACCFVYSARSTNRSIHVCSIPFHLDSSAILYTAKTQQLRSQLPTRQQARLTDLIGKNACIPSSTYCMTNRPCNPRGIGKRVNWLNSSETTVLCLTSELSHSSDRIAINVAALYTNLRSCRSDKGYTSFRAQLRENAIKYPRPRFDHQ